MSNAIRYDSLLVRDLAAELHTAFAGRRLVDVFLDRDALLCTLLTRARRRAEPPPSLRWHLHPASGHLTAAPGPGRGGRVQLDAGTRVRSVTAPPDERLVVLELDAVAAPAGSARRIIIELITNQWNVVAVGGDNRITAVLRERDTRERTLRAGVQYQAPAALRRAGSSERIPADAWHAALGPVEPGERLSALLRFAAWTSPLNAAVILGDADVTRAPSALDRALRRYLDMVWDTKPAPALLRIGERWQPYPRIEPASEAGEPVPTLLDGFALAAERAAVVPVDSTAADRALAAVARRLDAVARRMLRLRAQQEGAAAEAIHLRRQADLLLAQLHRVGRGAAAAELDDFEGGTLAVELDPALSAVDNATLLYDTARRRERAAARIPRLLGAAETERSRLEQLADRVRLGTAAPEELKRLETVRGAGGRTSTPSLPYREYRTSGGLEVRVGRGSRTNDELTFRHSSPTDIWLHARDVAGAHVILRWPHAETNPPAADIAEAAVLAALHSRARTSGTVPVDWTRRKYVRKPRRSPPGAVLPERVRTLFVEPDTAVEERLRADQD